MNIIGKCDFCGKEGKWEGMLYDNKKEVKKRSKECSASFPWNRPRIPDGCIWSPESLKKHGVTTRFACPECFR
jgi:hypothetical protein